MINRVIEHSIARDIRPGHVTVLYGARRTGKTILLEQLAGKFPDKKILLLNGEDYDIVPMLSSRKQSVLKSLLAGYDFVFIDEAQAVPDIGANLKLIVDTNPEIAVFVTGSSSFDLRNKIGEPLAGRSRYFQLYPFSLQEIASDYLTAQRLLTTLLVYGSYPQVVLAENEAEKRLLLENIRNGYLLKDILQLDNLKDSLFVMNLLRNLAFQICNDVSYNELAMNLHTTVKTVQRYLDILEKSFIIFRLHGFSRNLRKEINKSPRFYFWDNGIRNAVISRFEPLQLRDDQGQLWENFCIAERIKKHIYREQFSSYYYWRTYDQQEIDLIEEDGPRLSAFEFKWNSKPASVPRGFARNYPDAPFQTIGPELVFDFLTG
jgi:predicted AAA+ superfamily ATPase